MSASRWVLVSLGCALALGVPHPAAAQDSGAGTAETGGASTYVQTIVNTARDLLDKEPRDPALAAELLTEAVAAGNVEAMILLAGLYAEGDGVTRDYAAAETLLRQAIAAGNTVGGSVALAELYRDAEPPFGDAAKAVAAFETAVAEGDAGAMLNLARMVGWGAGVPVDFPRAEMLLKDAIAGGMARDGWSALAALYVESDDAHRDLAKAAEAYQRAADLGDSWAMLSLAQMLAQGNGVPVDAVRARELLEQAVAAGGEVSKWAWAGLGDLYRSADATRDPARAVEAYETAIELGNVGAMVSLGRMLGAGEGVPVDFERARRLLEDAIAAGSDRDGWAALAALYANAGEENRDLVKAADAYQQAADLGDPWAMLSLAQMLAQGNGVPVDFARAKALLDQAIATGGDMPQYAWAGMGDLYRFAAEGDRDPASAVAAYETAIDLGNAAAMVNLARMVGSGDGVAVDFVRAEALLDAAIAAGVGRDAWAAIANLYANADDEHRDLAKAAHAYQQAADLGDAWAMISLAQMLGQGNGVPADFARARALLEQAIATGGGMPPFAWAAMGDLYRGASPPDRDPARAVEAYETAIALGNPGAMVNLARLVGAGDGVPEDFARAETLLTDAIALGVGGDAWSALAVLYANAAEPHRDLAKAADAYQQAADLGDGWAMISLAQMLGQGTGVPVDFARARSLLEQAVALGGDMPQFAWAGLGDLYRTAADGDRDPARAAEAYETAISLGNTGALVSLGRMIGAGDGVPVDFGRAEGLLKDAIAAGVGRDAWGALAGLYANADEAHRDLAKAADAYQQAANLGDPWAMISLAQMLGQGNGVPADFDRAKVLLDRAMASGGDMPVFVWAAVGDLYRTAGEDRRDPGLAVEAYETAITLGNTGAMVSLARMLGAGDGVPVDFARAEMLLNDAIAAGVGRDGWSALAGLYANADAADRDLPKAADAYQQAANLGDPWAMISLAQMLGQGNGVPADFGRAKALLDAAIAAGGEMPQFGWAAMGDLYRSADGANRDPAAAVAAYETAIELGNTGAMVSLARMLGAGDGVPADFARAESLLEEAIAAGAARDGWAGLAALYAFSEAPHRDLPKAAEAYQEAADLGDPWSMLSLAQLLLPGGGMPVDVDRGKALLDAAIAAGLAGPAGKVAGDLHMVGPEEYRDVIAALGYYKVAAAAGDGAAHFAVADIEARSADPAKLASSIATHLRAAASALGVAEVGRTMFNLSPVSTLYVMVQALLLEDGHRVQVDGVFGNQTKTALANVCAAKGMSSCQTAIITMAVLTALLASPGS
jgi:TPR repeat protein